MKFTNRLRRWSMRSIHSMILGASLLGPASMVVAQTPGAVAAKLPNQNFARSHSFDLPLNMEPEARANVSEIRLYMKTPATNWMLQESAQPFQTRFVCKVPQDGEYWYSLVIVDRAGRMTPTDVNLVPPQQRVVVDTVPPVLQVKTSNGPDGALHVRCTMEDANPDPTTFKVVGKSERGDVAFEVVPSQPGLFRLKGSESVSRVVVSAMDLAKNAVTDEINVRTLPEVAPTASLPNRSGPDITLMSARPDPNGLTPRDGPPLLPRTELPPMLHTPTKNDLVLKTELPTTEVHRTEAAKTEIVKTEAPKTEGPVFPGLSNRMEIPTPPPLNPLTMSAVNTPVTGEPVKMPSSENTPRGSVPYQLINTTHAAVDYRIDQVGPSGVGKVEIWMTSDKGQSWHRLGEDPDKRSPADIVLPGDGVYGIRIVITNGNGFGGHAPIRGDAPHCQIEVDTTCPFVQLRSAEVLPSSGDVEIRWNAQDKNLGSTPVDLFYRTRAEGPWQVVARGLKNDGTHRWAFPREASAQFFFKIEVADQAGNRAHDMSRQAVVIDTTEPRATVVGVTGSGSVRATPNE